MPLPQADKTATYERIQTKRVQYPINNFKTDTRDTSSILSQEDFQIIKNAIITQETNEDELRRLNLIGTSTNQSSLSGPFRNIKVTGVLSSAGNVLLQPDLPGQYTLSAIDAVVIGGSGTQKYELWYGSISESNEVRWFYQESSDSGVIFSGDANYPDFPIYFDDNFFLVGRLADAGSGVTSVTFRAILTQVR